MINQRITKPDWEIKRDWDNDPEFPTVFHTKGFSKHGFPGEIIVCGSHSVCDTEAIDICALINCFCIAKINGYNFEYEAENKIGKFKFFLHEIDRRPPADIKPENVCKYQLVLPKRIRSDYVLIMGAKGFRRDALAMISEQRWGRLYKLLNS